MEPLAHLPKIHPNVDDETLLGGLDVAATLSSGGIVQKQGLISGSGGVILTMAERISPSLAARLAAQLDARGDLWCVALDEGADESEAVPRGLADRLAFFVDLGNTRFADVEAARWPDAISVSEVLVAAEIATAVAELTLQLGIDSARAAHFTLRTARGVAALRGSQTVEDADLEQAASLVLPHRATRLPEPPEEQDQPDEPPPDNSDSTADTDGASDEVDLPAELLLEAVLSMIPPDLLQRLAQRSDRTGRGSGSGSARKGNRRGRPLPPRPGRIGGGARIDVVATLRSALPWQKMRGGSARSIKFRTGDIRIKRFEETSDRLLIFAVDASGSAALARLAEAKGAVEILLSEAYARRDHVALIGFRGDSAETLLPPTRSLVQTKRRLAALPGGGGTPLAAGLRAALDEARIARRRGYTPTVCLLTDGRANVALDGRADRAAAAEDAQQIARLLRAERTEAIVIDTGRRPERALSDLAALLDALYLPMPRADAERVSAAVSASLSN